MIHSRVDIARKAFPLLASLLAGSPASAEQRSGWVDPPAKAATAETETPEKKPVVEASREARPVRPAKRRLSRPENGRPVTHATGHRPEVGSSHSPRASIAAGQAAARTVSAYLAAISSDGGLASSADRFYGERVRFHGRTMTRSALASEKARFARRWPVRIYEPRGAARTRCDAAGTICTVTTAFDFRAANPARGARSTGLGELTVTIGFAGERPVILSEASRVLQRGSVTLSNVDRSGDAG